MAWQFECCFLRATRRPLHSGNFQRSLYVELDDSPLLQPSAFLKASPPLSPRDDPECHIISHPDLPRPSSVSPPPMRLNSTAMNASQEGMSIPYTTQAELRKPGRRWPAFRL
ncbi:hypothetical protein R3P38DRAFT_3222889 [Favolaschia claudopus]|uniref:Uncharacterized protein n=1 Tax=Favolaschia claudopus TaxID=2862362 RepID=A0AAV9ZZ26_9AGAR